ILLTPEDRKKLPENKVIGDVLKNKSASSLYVDLLFGAMAHAAGFETRVALLPNRSETFFTPKMTNSRLIRPAAIAVKIGDDWKYFNPGTPFLPFGQLVWYREDCFALLIAEKDWLWKRTPMTGSETSVAKRTGKLRLLEDGTLEGEIRIELSGQQALAYRLA